MTPFYVGHYLIVTRPDGRSEVWYDKDRSWLLDRGSLAQLLIDKILKLMSERELSDQLPA